MRPSNERKKVSWRKLRKRARGRIALASSREEPDHMTLLGHVKDFGCH